MKNEKKIKSGGPLYSHTACTHVPHIVSGDTHAHTHTHAGGTTVEGVLCFFPSWRPPPGTARSRGQPGDQVQVLGPDMVRDRTDEHLLFLHVGVLWGEPR